MNADPRPPPGPRRSPRGHGAAPTSTESEPRTCARGPGEPARCLRRSRLPREQARPPPGLRERGPGIPRGPLPGRRRSPGRPGAMRTDAPAGEGLRSAQRPQRRPRGARTRGVGRAGRGLGPRVGLGLLPRSSARTSGRRDASCEGRAGEGPRGRGRARPRPRLRAQDPGRPARPGPPPASEVEPQPPPWAAPSPRLLSRGRREAPRGRRSERSRLSSPRLPRAAPLMERLPVRVVFKPSLAPP